MKYIEKEIKICVKYLKSQCDNNKKYFVGGLEEPKYINELSLDIYDDMIYDFDKDEWEKNGKYVLDISGSDRSLFEFGKYLINMSMYNTLDPDFHEHFDDINDSKGNKIINLIVRKGQ